MLCTELKNRASAQVGGKQYSPLESELDRSSEVVPGVGLRSAHALHFPKLLMDLERVQNLGPPAFNLRMDRATQAVWVIDCGWVSVLSDSRFSRKGTAGQWQLGTAPHPGWKGTRSSEDFKCFVVVNGFISLAAGTRYEGRI